MTQRFGGLKAKVSEAKIEEYVNLEENEGLRRRKERGEESKTREWRISVTHASNVRPAGSE